MFKVFVILDSRPSMYMYFWLKQCHYINMASLYTYQNTLSFSCDLDTKYFNTFKLFLSNTLTNIGLKYFEIHEVNE